MAESNRKLSDNQSVSSISERASQLASGAFLLRGADADEACGLTASARPNNLPTPSSVSTDSTLSDISEQDIDTSGSTQSQAAASAAPAAAETISTSNWQVDAGGLLTGDERKRLADLAKSILKELEPFPTSKATPVTPPFESQLRPKAHISPDASAEAVQALQQFSQKPVHQKPGRKCKYPTSFTTRRASSKQCSHCFTRETPLWRRGPSKELLCNACALFLKNRGKIRPVGETTQGSTSSPLKGSPSVHHLQGTQKSKTCDECRLGDALLWRQDDNGHLLCQSCWEAEEAKDSNSQLLRRSSRTRARKTEKLARTSPSTAPTGSKTKREASVDPDMNPKKPRLEAGFEAYGKRPTSSVSQTSALFQNQNILTDKLAQDIPFSVSDVGTEPALRTAPCIQGHVEQPISASCSEPCLFDRIDTQGAQLPMSAPTRGSGYPLPSLKSILGLSSSPVAAEPYSRAAFDGYSVSPHQPTPRSWMTASFHSDQYLTFPSPNYTLGPSTAAFPYISPEISSIPPPCLTEQSRQQEFIDPYALSVPRGFRATGSPQRMEHWGRCLNNPFSGPTLGRTESQTGGFECHRYPGDDPFAYRAVSSRAVSSERGA